MSRHPTQPEPGRRPLDLVLEKSPTCHLCTWAFRLRSLLFELKYINARCASHRSLPVLQPAEAFL